ncbi:multidrug ABC transporter permease [Anaerobacillus alkaliphilus]|uniref:Multidrug ABC transporter permease n=1 Tax=Anaerobacillus alkaliphilus TaxID=1548597 RepID=A0A4Q0VUF6_9BACI|nr:multidrug ABC transporter permease [Anaerobacillus alkaliphilus]RXJ02007.1 multidrug ABC transporter permease [Anaerobacillus alkaliphilus]
MQLKTLLFNRGIYIQNLKNVGWIGILYLLCLWFAVPLQILMISSSYREYRQHYAFTSGSLFSFMDGFQYLLMFTVPILLAIFLFRYMHVKLSADYIHSLPIKRGALFFQNVLFGTIVLAVPVIITGLSLFVISGFVDAPTILTVSAITEWIGTTLLLIVFVFAVAVFVGMFTGISVFHGVLTYILFIFPAGITILFFMNVKYLLHGFAVDYYLDKQVEKLIPFIRASNLVRQGLTTNEVVFFLLITVIALAIGYIAYQKRKVETATQAIAFRSLQPVFLYGVTACAMLLGGMYFGETQGTLGWQIFGYVAASIIGYFIALMILEKSWRVLTKWKGYGIFVAVMVVLALLIKFDITGYENRLPTIDNIERVYFGESIYLMDENHFYYTDLEREYGPRYYYKDQTNIENIREIHKDIIKNSSRFGQLSGYYRQVVIGYELTSGKKIVRHYRVPENFYLEPNELYSSLVESQEHKRNVHGLLRIEDATKIDKISIISTRGNNQLTITDRDDIISFHETFQAELREETIDEITSKSGYWATVEYLMKDNQRATTSWNKHHELIEAWLAERDLVSKARLTAEDIAYAVIIKKDKEYLHEYMRYEEEMRDFEKRPDAIKIDNNEEIEVCLQVSNWDDRGEYVIAYYSTKDYTSPIFETISLKDAPFFIKDKLN